MNSDTIKRAVELAPGWEIDYGHLSAPYNLVHAPNIDEMEPWELAALASALVEMVLKAGYDIHIDIQGSHFKAPGQWIEITDMELSETTRYERDARDNPDENTIEAIVQFMEDK